MRVVKMAVVTMAVVMMAAIPAFAAGGGKASPALTKLAAEYLKAHPKDVRVLVASAGLGDETGGAALVRLDDGADGGNPVCYLLTTAGRPSSPAKIENAARFQVCPRADQGKQTHLERINLGRRNGWLMRLDSQRWDSMAKGGEFQLYWAITADLGDGAGLRPVFERTSTAFKSKDNPALNQSEVCKAPVVTVSAGEPQGASIACEIEGMHDHIVKKSSQTFNYMWDGSQFAAK